LSCKLNRACAKTSFEIVFVNMTCSALSINMFILSVYDLNFHKFQIYYVVLNHFHLNMCKDQELSTIPCLHSIGIKRV
jgi:hypothetical protein